MRVRLDPQLRVEATELHRRRVGSGSSYAPKLATVLAQVGLLHGYGRELRTGDIDAWMRVAPTDENGTMLITSITRKVFGRPQPGRAYVFASVEDDEIIYRGWMPGELLEPAPVTKDRVDSDEYREIEDPFLAPMPEEFRFEDDCAHVAGTWDENYDAWHCICGRRIHDPWTRGVASGAIQLVAAVQS
jgi:hypothetical protein